MQFHTITVQLQLTAARLALFYTPTLVRYPYLLAAFLRATLFRYFFHMTIHCPTHNFF